MLTRQTWAQIDLNALKNNIDIIKNTSQKALFAVIKANAYGCGAEIIARYALEYGADYLVVSSMDEGLDLRRKGIDGNILILSYTDPRFIDLAIENNFTLTVPSLNWVQRCEKNDYSNLKVHIKVDTGMNRVGICDLVELEKTLALLNMKHFNIEGIFSHYACSDNPDGIMVNKQFSRFYEAIQTLNYPFKWIHISNSDGTLHYPDKITNAVRAGLAMYGIASYESDLKSVMSLYSRLIQAKKVYAGETIGYGATYMVKSSEWIGTLPIGYADGWLRKNQNGQCYLKGSICTFVGRICMDQCMIKMPKEFPIDSVVELFGPHISIMDVAKRLDTIPYEIMTSVSDRVTRIYQKDKETVAIVNKRFLEF